MRAGNLRHLLTIEQVTETRDDFGQAIEAWAEFATVPGSLDPLGGRERFLAAQTHAEATYRSRIRWIEGLTSKMRISHGGKVYNITHIADDGRRRELVLDLVEGLTDG